MDFFDHGNDATSEYRNIKSLGCIGALVAILIIGAS
jgi:hypothetical protein